MALLKKNGKGRDTNEKKNGERKRVTCGEKIEKDETIFFSLKPGLENYHPVLLDVGSNFLYI